nr:GNAT family N-acetyltransferase [Arenimonas sp.]
IQASGADVLVLRVRSGDVATPRALAAADAELIYADSLVYYGISPGRGRDALQPPPGVVVRAAAASDEASIDRIARLAFRDYASHYAANPRLHRPGDIALGYAEWAVDHLRATDPCKSTWVAEADSQVVAFATVRSPAAPDVSEVLLNAVSPGHQGRGVYPALLSGILSGLQSRGVAALRISTQLANVRVQRAWSRLGFEIESAYDTYHLNFTASTDEGVSPP